MTTESPLGARLHQLIPAAAIGVGLMVACVSVLGVEATVIVLGLPLAAAGAWFAIRRPGVMVTAMVLIEVTNLAGVVAEHSRFPVFHASLALGMVTVAIAFRDPANRDRLTRGTALCVGLVAVYFVTGVLAALGSQDQAVSMAAVKSSLTDCIFLLVVLLLTQMSGRWWAVAAAIVVPLAAISLLTVISQVGFDGAESFGGFATVTEASGELVTTLRFGGPLPDSNFWGRHLVLGLPLAAALIVRASRCRRRAAVVGWAAALAALLAGVYLTQSRGSIIAAGVAILVWVLACGPAIRRRGLLGLPVLALLLLVPGIGNRLVALVADVSRVGSTYTVDPSVLGRLAAQEVAWAMFRDRPLFGFGPDVYPVALPHYAGIVETAVLGPTDAAHNLYAQTAAETGIVGLVGWAVFVLGFIALIGIRVIRIPPKLFLPERALAAAVLAAIIGWSVASVFLHLAYFRTFAIVLALAGALGSAAGPALGSTIQARPSKIKEAVLATVMGVVAAALVFAVTPTAAQSTASQQVTIVPTAQMKGYYGYAFDIRTRPVVLPTYAALITAGDRSVSAVADRVRGVIKISASGTDPASARADLDAALTRSTHNLSAYRADAWYRLNLVGGVQERTEHTRSTAWTVAALVSGVLAYAATIAGLRRWTRIPRHRRAFGNSPETGAVIR